ncbi:MAG: hypothetical protein QOC63_3152, partial [Mycobacterium sp.]|nr:hypothetical protein [Mycobacterium sp.]
MTTGEDKALPATAPHAPGGGTQPAAAPPAP